MNIVGNIDLRSSIYFIIPALTALSSEMASWIEQERPVVSITPFEWVALFCTVLVPSLTALRAYHDQHLSRPPPVAPIAPKETLNPEDPMI